MSAASKQRLAHLHSLLTEDMISRLEHGEEEIIGGEVVRVKARPATLGHIAKFLKDNGIEALAEHDDRFKHLAGKIDQIIAKTKEYN